MMMASLSGSSDNQMHFSFKTEIFSLEHKLLSPRSKSSSPIPSFCSITFPSHSFVCGAGGFTDARPAPASLTLSVAQYGKKASTRSSLTANPRLFGWPQQKPFLCYAEVRLPKHLRPVLRPQFWNFPVRPSELI